MGKTNYEVDSQQLQMDIAPVIHQDRTMLPIRYITEPLGAKLSWDAATQKVAIELSGKKIELWIGKSKSEVHLKPAVIPSGAAILPAGD